MNIIKLSKPNCRPCTSVAKYLNDRDINYTEYDIKKYPKLIDKYNLTGVPVVILLDGDKEVVRANYFNPVELDRLIEVYKQ